MKFILAWEVIIEPMGQGLGWLIIAGVWSIIGIAITVGTLYLQYRLSKAKNKWLGLIIPVVELTNLITAHSWPDFPMLFAFLIVSESVLLGIYFITRKKLDNGRNK